MSSKITVWRTRTWSAAKKHPAWIMGVIIIILLILLLSKCTNTTPTGTLGSTPGVTATATATVSPSPTATASASAVVPPATDTPSPSPSPTQNCVAPPTGINYQLSITQVEPAANTDWSAQFKGTELTRVDYIGAFADKATAGKFLDSAKCNGFYAGLKVDNVFEQHMSPGEQDAYFAEVARHGHLVNWDVQSGTDCAARQKILSSTGVAPLLWGVWPLNADENICKPVTMPVYLPYPEPNSYGSPSNYAKVGRDIYKVLQSSGWAAIQAYDISAVNPGMASQFGFHSGRPSSDEVAGFAHQLRDQGIRKILIYVEGKVDAGYIKEVIHKVAAVISH